MCDAGCNAQNTLSHIFKYCIRTHRLRFDRHNSVLDLIVRKVGSKLKRSLGDPRDAWKRKPDMMAQVHEVVYLIDVTITTDCTDLRGPYDEKVRY